MKYLTLFILIAISLWLTSCQNQKTCQPLPILGEREVVEGDTVYNTIPDFSFISQDSQIVTNATFEDRIYIADFFFISCPTICPKVKKQMLRVYEAFKDDDRIMFLSHSIDVRHDTVPRLKAFSEGMGVDGQRWLFVTGDEGAIFDIAADYYSIAVHDENAPGGFDHSGRLILVDKDRRVRGFCDGTDPASVDQFMKSIKCLLDEQP